MSNICKKSDKLPCTVYIGDNFHYTDEDELYEHGSFATYEEAVAACKRIVEREVAHIYKQELTALELFDLYMSFGEDPFVKIPSGIYPPFTYGSWDYAKEYAAKMCAPNAVAFPQEGAADT